MVNPIINLERALEQILKECEDIAIKRHNTLVTMPLDPMRSNSSKMEEVQQKSDFSMVKILAQDLKGACSLKGY